MWQATGSLQESPGEVSSPLRFLGNRLGPDAVDWMPTKGPSLSYPELSAPGLEDSVTLTDTVRDDL